MARNASDRVLDGQPWSDFCRALEEAGQTVLRNGSPLDPFDRAEGFRYLSRLTRTALETFLEFADPEFPVLFRPAHETVKIGADNPDNFYQKAAISGGSRYRISGQRGSVHYLGFGTYAGDYGSGGRRGQTGYLEASDMAVDDQGHFEIIVSCEDPGGANWLPMEPDTSSLIVRQTFEDRKVEKVADLEIICLDASTRPQALTPEALDQGLARAAAFVGGTARLFSEWSEGFAKKPNELPAFDPAIAGAAHGDPHIRYYHGYFKIDPGEALVVDLQPPPCDYWNFQLNNHWMESLDWRYQRVDLNHRTAHAEADGSVRIVVAHEDPGHPNWLDPAGHIRGTMCLRWIRAAHHPNPTLRLVPLNELAAAGLGRSKS